MQITDKITLLGHSLGAHVVAAYAMGYPDRVQHLILASPIGVGVTSRHQQELTWRKALPCLSRCVWRVGERLWEFGWTPQDLLRWLGPLGASVVVVCTIYIYIFVCIYSMCCVCVTAICCVYRPNGHPPTLCMARTRPTYTDNPGPSQ